MYMKNAARRFWISAKEILCVYLKLYYYARVMEAKPFDSEMGISWA